jgi:hypothetical protein
MTDSGNAAQTRIIAEQVAEAAVVKFAAEHPEFRQPKVPEMLKWAGGVIGALLTAGIMALAFWLVTSVSDMQTTLVRLDERIGSGAVKDARFDDLERRVTSLEGYHKQGGGQ